MNGRGRRCRRSSRTCSENDAVVSQFRLKHSAAPCPIKTEQSDATCEQRNDHTSQRSDMMLLPKWMRWAGLGLCAAMVPAMAAVAKPATHKKTNTSAQH